MSTCRCQTSTLSMSLQKSFLGSQMTLYLQNKVRIGKELIALKGDSLREQEVFDKRVM